MGVLNGAPMMPRDASLWESYTSDRCGFSNLCSYQYFFFGGNDLQENKTLSRAI